MIYRIVGGIGRSLIFSGVVLLLFVGFQLWGTGLDEARFQDDLTRSLGESVGLAGEDIDEDSDQAEVAQQITDQLDEIDPATAPPAELPKEGEAGGFIEIPKIALRAKTFVEGVNKADLRKGPGHYTGTPFPGNAGNSAIAGHRSTYGAPFNRIDELVPGDQIVTYTAQGKFVYEVMVSPVERRQGAENKNWGQGWFTVNPRDVSVLDPTEDNRLTLTACHPKYSAKLRIIVVARLIAEPAEAAPIETTANGNPDASQAVSTTQTDLIAGDPTQLRPALMFAGLVVLLWLAAMGAAELLRRRLFARVWPIYVATVATSAVPLWFAFVHLDRFMPAL